MGIIRLLLSIVCYIPINKALKKSTKLKIKAKRIIAVALLFVLVLGFGLLPVEDLFVTFSTPQSAYRYQRSYTYDVDLVVEGESTVLVVGSHCLGRADNEFVLSAFEKKEGGYKLGFTFEFKPVNLGQLDNKYIYHVYKHTASDDYYIHVMSSFAVKTDVADISGKPFSCIQKDDRYYYYGYAHRMEEGYSLIIDGKEYNIDITEV